MTDMVQHPPHYTGPTTAYYEGVEAERERIIKLLESDEWHDIAFATRSPDEQPTKYHDGECLGCRQIALIKGEQK